MDGWTCRNQTGLFDRQNRVAHPRALVMERGGHESLAGAPLPQDTDVASNSNGRLGSDFLERHLIDVVLGDLGGDASARQAADTSATADVAARLLERLANVLLLDCRSRLAQQDGQRA